MDGYFCSTSTEQTHDSLPVTIPSGSSSFYDTFKNNLVCDILSPTSEGSIGMKLLITRFLDFPIYLSDEFVRYNIRLPTYLQHKRGSHLSFKKSGAHCQSYTLLMNCTTFVTTVGIYEILYSHNCNSPAAFSVAATVNISFGTRNNWLIFLLALPHLIRS